MLKYTELTDDLTAWPAIEDLGDMPFSLVQDVLEVMRPEKLQEIETASPHLLEHTNGKWHEGFFFLS